MRGLKNCRRIDFTIPEVQGRKVQIGSRTYIIVAHKPREAESIISQLKYDTPLTRLITMASHDPLVRAWCFLSYERLAEESNIKLPVIPTIRKDSIEIKKEKIQHVAERTLKEVETIMNIAWSSFSKAISDLVREHMRKSEKLRHERGKKKEWLFNRLMERLEYRISCEIARHKDEIERFYNFMEAWGLSFVETIRITEIHSVLSELLENFEKIKSIYEHMADAICAKQITALEIQELLSKLEESGVLYGIIITSVCLMPSCRFNVTSYNIVEFPQKCPFCRGENMLNLFYAWIQPDVKNAWELGLIPEMVVAYMFYDKDWVKSVYLHKALQQLIDSSTSSVKLDVIIFTKNGKVIVIEVTTHRDESVIMRSIERKVKTIQESGVCIDALFYVTSAPFQRYFQYIEEPFSVWILGRRHLAKLDEHIEYILKKQQLL